LQLKAGFIKFNQTMNEDLKKAVIKALEKNHKNGPLTARNLASIYENIIEANATLPADKIASMINDADIASDSEEDDDE